MKVSIIGCGLIGQKRALSLSDDYLVSCCDTDPNVLKIFSTKFNCMPYEDFKDAIDKHDVDIVIVAVINKYALPIISYALAQGKHVLAEKPLGRNVAESLTIVSLAAKNGVLVKTGFNHRFHPGIWEAKQILDSGKIGKPIVIRARYGHGGRNGMETEWRASKDLCGGGELLDQGVHVIDLCNWFAGDMESVYGRARTLFWDMDVEDNAFALMNSISGVEIQFHVSWTNWRNIFSFELFAEEGYLRVEGLGGSYGDETLEYGLRNKKGGKPDIKLFKYSPQDLSWEAEWKEFSSAIKEKRLPIGSGLDGLYANRVIEAIYRSSESDLPLTIPALEAQ